MRFTNLIVTTILTTILHPAFAHQSTCPTQKRFSNLMNEFMAEEGPIAGVSIAVMHPQCGEYVYSTGVTDDTRMPIASNTKPILAVIALTLIENHPEEFPQGLQTKLSDIRDFNGGKIFSADGKLLSVDGTEIDMAKPLLYEASQGHAFDCQNDSVYSCPRFDNVDLHHLLLESSGFANIFENADLDHDGLPDAAISVLGSILKPYEGPNKHYMNDFEALKFYGVVKQNNQDPIVPQQSHNTDATILSVILQRATAKSLNELLDEYILRPLNLPKDSMRFVTGPNPDNTEEARHYALLNSNEEIAQAIETGHLLKGIKPEIANFLRPAVMEAFEHKLEWLTSHDVNEASKRQALDMLTIDEQGAFGMVGAGGIVAKPKAYVKFYDALTRGTLLSRQAQAFYEASFTPVKTADGGDEKIGYASTHYALDKNNQYYYRHAGFIIGGQSLVSYGEKSHMTIMIASNLSGHNPLANLDVPSFLVTDTPYFSQSEMVRLREKLERIWG